MSNRSRRAPGPSSPGRTGTSTKRASSTRRVMGVPGAVPGTRRQKARKSCSPRRASARAGHGPQVERARHVPGHRGQERVRRLVLEDQVAVAPGPGRAPGVEPGAGPPRPTGPRRRAEHGVHRPHQRGRGPRPSRTSTWTTWPRAWTPASVRPAQMSSTAVADDDGDGLGQRAGHGALARLGGEAAEPGPVVGDRQPQPWYGGDSRAGRSVAAGSAGSASRSDRRRRPHPGGGLGGGREVGVEQGQTSSMRAMGALSPWRGPSFRIRV